MKKISLFIFQFFIFSQCLFASFHLPDIMSDGMVLQQQSEVCLWAFANKGEIVTLNVDWQDTALKVKADKSGLVKFHVSTPKASFKSHKIVFSSGKDSVVVSDILIGEVWFASGQSNMEMPLNGFWNCPINESQEEIATSAEWASRIRMATVPKTGNTEPQEEVAGKWQLPSAETSPWMSAAAWHFAKMLTRVLDCPIGIISCAWGGTAVEGWIPRDTLLTYADIDLPKQLKEGWNGQWWECYTPLVMYNAMLHPLRHYTIRGFLWYQGEANVGKDNYAERLATMVNVWRREFGDTEDMLPFYLTEIAPWTGYGEWLSAPLLREQQHLAAQIIPNSGCICTNDLVEFIERNNIHPAEKKQVGYRLAYMALNRTYGYRQIACDSPEYLRHEVQGNQVEVYFKYADEGLSPWQDITGFELAGADGVFHKATATLNEEHKTLIVKSDSVETPVSVRYCFRAFSLGNVHNHRNLPLVPFRSDK